MDYVSIDKAQAASGLRLVLTGGLPAPWSEAAKGVFRARKVSYIPVLQEGGGANEEIVAWTGHRYFTGIVDSIAAPECHWKPLFYRR